MRKQGKQRRYPPMARSRATGPMMRIWEDEDEDEEE